MSLFLPPLLIVYRATIKLWGIWILVLIVVEKSARFVCYFFHWNSLGIWCVRSFSVTWKEVISMGNVRGAGRKILIARPAASRGRGKVKRYRHGSSCNYGLFWFASRKRQVGDSRPRPLASSESDVSGTSITSRPIEIYPAVTLPSSSSLSFPTHTLPIESNTQHPFLSQNTASPQPIVNIPSDKEYTLISFLHQGFLIAQVVCVRPNTVTSTNGSIVVLCWRDYCLATGVLLMGNNISLVSYYFFKSYLGE